MPSIFSGTKPKYPTWVGAPASAMTLISTITSSGTHIAWTNLSGYNNYVIIFNNIKFNSTALVNLYIQLGTGATTYTTSGYYSNSSGRVDNNGSFSDNSNTSLNASQGNLIGNNIYFTSTASFNGYMYLTGFTSNSSQGILSYLNFQDTTNQNYGFLNDSVTNAITSPITAIRLYGNTSSSVFGGGTASLYGISS